MIFSYNKSENYKSFNYYLLKSLLIFNCKKLNIYSNLQLFHKIRRGNSCLLFKSVYEDPWGGISALFCEGCNLIFPVHRVFIKHPDDIIDAELIDVTCEIMVFIIFITSERYLVLVERLLAIHVRLKSCLRYFFDASNFSSLKSSIFNVSSVMVIEDFTPLLSLFFRLPFLLYCFHFHAVFWQSVLRTFYE